MAPRGKYTEAVHKEIIKNLEAGCFRVHAANAAGVSVDTMDDWVAQGDAGIAPYVKFAADVHQALGRDAVRNQTIITRAAMGPHDGDWKAAAWNLEKKFPKVYGRLAEAGLLNELERPQSPWKQPPPSDEPAERKLDS